MFLITSLTSFDQSAAINSIRPLFARVMIACYIVAPQAEPPLVASDEVGVVFGDAVRTRLFPYAFQRLRLAKPRRSPPSADFLQTRFFKELGAFARGDVRPHGPKPGERTSEGHPTADACPWPLVNFAGCVARCTCAFPHSDRILARLLPNCHRRRC